MILAVFAVLAAVFFMAERFFPLAPQRLFRRGFVTDLCYIPIHYLMRVVVNGVVAVALVDFGRRTLPFAVDRLQDWPLWIQTVTLLLVLDLIFYVTHRLKHRWTWWWRLHETHHSSIDLDWLSSTRFHPLEKLLDRTIYLLPLLVLGASDEALVIWAAVDAGFGMFIHSNTTWRLGPLIYVFVGPEMHRWHHVRDPRRRECNYGNNFSIFDWIFGTAYLAPAGQHARDFGCDVPDYPDGNIVKQFFFAFRSVRPHEAAEPAPSPAPACDPEQARV